jgi:hypothetical protein
LGGAVATLDDLAKYALALPSAAVRNHYGGPDYHVAGRSFALYWPPECRVILKLPRPRQALLFEIRPETFTPCPVGRGGVWSYVAIETLEAGELGELVIEAWRTVAPKRLSRSIGDDAGRA